MEKKLRCLEGLFSFFMQMAIEITIACIYGLMEYEVIVIASQDWWAIMPSILFLIGVRLYLVWRDCKTFRESNLPEVLAGFSTVLLCSYYGLSDIYDLALYECALLIGYYIPRMKMKVTQGLPMQ